MRLPALFFAALVMLSGALEARQAISRHSVAASVAGETFVLGTQYGYRLGNHLAIQAGLGISMASVPALNTGMSYISPGTHRFETGVSTLLLQDKNGQFNSWIGPLAGYRYQRDEGGPLFRLYLMHVTSQNPERPPNPDRGSWFWPGLSWGWSF